MSVWKGAIIDVFWRLLFRVLTDALGIPYTTSERISWGQSRPGLRNLNPEASSDRF